MGYVLPRRLLLIFHCVANSVQHAWMLRAPVAAYAILAIVASLFPVVFMLVCASRPAPLSKGACASHLSCSTLHFVCQVRPVARVVEYLISLNAPRLYFCVSCSAPVVSLLGASSLLLLSAMFCFVSGLAPVGDASPPQMPNPYEDFDELHDRDYSTARTVQLDCKTPGDIFNFCRPRSGTVYQSANGSGPGFFSDADHGNVVGEAIKNGSVVVKATNNGSIVGKASCQQEDCGLRGAPADEPPKGGCTIS